MKTFAFSIITAFLMFLACSSGTNTAQQQPMGSIERIDPALDAIISKDAKVEILGQGYDWAEGPLWVESEKMLLFSDVPKNVIHKWSESTGVVEYLKPSGYTGTVPRGGEMGSNGLTLSPDGKLVLAQHGDRRIAMMDAPLNKPAPIFKTIADKYDGKKLSSPNDVIMNKAGETFFTDPPYGLPSQRDSDPGKELTVNGVYKVKKDGTVILLLDSLNRPNGLALSRDEKKLFVANSDPRRDKWYVYDVDGDKLKNGKTFGDATGIRAGGLCDGFKVDANGNIFSGAPGGIWIFNPEGKLLGKIVLPQNTANCALTPDGKTLFMTSDMYLLRMKLRP